jgi:hypothetical protein
MITPYEMTALTTYDSYQLARLLAISGYSGMSFESSWFEGITQDRAFCYAVEFYDDSGTGEIATGKVYLTYDEEEKSIVADF